MVRSSWALTLAGNSASIVLVLLLVGVACNPQAPVSPSASPVATTATGTSAVVATTAAATVGASPETTPVPNEASNASLRWAFTQAGDHPDVLLADGIAQATREIDAAIYAINRPADVQALADAQTRCQCVRLISDATQSGSDAKQSAALVQLQAAGVPVRVDSHSGLMHMKVVEIDRMVVYEGSFNVTNNASTLNDEILVRVGSATFATAVAAEFETMWVDPRRFKPWQAPPVGVPPPPELPEF